MPDVITGAGRMDLAATMAAWRRAIPFKLPGLAIVAAALAILLSVVVPGFASIDTLQSMMFQLPQLGLLAFAMMIPLISGGLNLAVIAIANASALTTIGVVRLLDASGATGLPAILATAAGLFAGLVLATLLGATVGWLIARTRVHPILVSLGVMSIVEGVSILITRGKVVSGLPALYGLVGNAVVIGIPVPFLCFAAVAAVLAVILTRTPFGISLAMMGSNPDATRYSAVNVDRLLIKVYASSGVLCFLASCLMLAKFNSASAAYAKSYLLVTVLASVLGGVDPFGGFGKVGGVVLALIVLQLIATGCNLLGFSDYLTLAIWGLALILVTCLQTLSRPR